MFTKIKAKLSNKFIKSTGWLSIGELVSRIFRILLTVFIARLLSPSDYGVAAIALTMFDIVSIFANNNGIGGKLIQVSEDKLGEYCNTSYWLNVILSPLLFLGHVLISLILSYLYNNSSLFLPLVYVGLGFLLLPFSSVQGALLYRENKFKPTAYCNVMQTILGSLITIVLAYLGFGSWSLILPALAIAFGWMLIIRLNHPWRNNSSFTLNNWKDIFHFGKNILFVSVTEKIRDNADYLIVGKFLGVEALGLYFFAFNAGLGIPLSLINNFTGPLYPYLCEVKNDLRLLHKRYTESLRLVCSIIFPLVLLQVILAPMYVPIIYGSKWSASIPILMIICLSALARPFGNAANKLLISLNLTHVVSVWSSIYCLIFVSMLFVGVYSNGVIGVAIATLLSTTILQSSFYLWTNNKIFNRKK